MEEKKKILVLCGGKFAFKSLQLLAYEKNLCGVGIGKGSEIIIDALERESEDNGIAFKSFPNKNSLSEMREWINTVQPDYIFSISFPFLIPIEVLNYGEEKFINFHPGPLPQYRGVMPIFEVLKNQETETAISTHFMNSKFDEGNIIFNDPITIEKGETYGKLAIKLSNRMAQVALNVVNMVQFGSKIPNFPQDESKAYYYEKPLPTDTYINWKRMDSDEIISLINACNPWNSGADTTFMGEQAKIIVATIFDKPHNARTGTVTEIIDENKIAVACSDNKQIAIEVLSTEEGIMTIKQLNNQKNLIGEIFN